MTRNRRSALVTWGCRLAGTATAMIGIHWIGVWLGGWAAVWAASGAITVKFNMALALVLSGVTLLLVSRSAREKGRAPGTVLASVVLMIGALTLSEHVFRIDLGIDQLFATEPPGAIATVSPNRMGPMGAMDLVLLGAGLLSLYWWNRRPVAQYLGLALCVITLVPAVGFLYGAEELYEEAHLTAMAWPTVVAQVLLGLGLILADANKDPMGRYLHADAGGAVLRRMVPAVITIPLVFGFLIANGQRQGFFDTPMGIGLLVIASILIFSLFLWRTASVLSREEEVARQARTDLHASRAWFHTLFGTISEGFCTIEVIVDERGTPIDFLFLETNRAFEKLTRQRNVEGKLVSELSPVNESNWLEIFGRVALTGESVQFENKSKPTGRWYGVSAFRFGQPEERKVAILFNDVTERKQAEEALRSSEERLRVALKAGGAGAFDWDLVTGVAVISDSYRELYGIKPEAPFTYDSWLESVHADDRERCRAYGEAFFASKDAENWELEFRINAPHLGVRWHHATGRVERDETGKPQRFVGVSTDVTDRKRIEESEERLKVLMSRNPSLVFLKDESGRYVYLNESYEKLYVHTRDWFGKTDFDFWPKESAELFRANDAEILRSGQTRQVLEDSLDMEGKRHCWLAYKFPFTDSKGNRYLGGIGIDATDRVLAEEAVREQQRQLNLAIEAGQLVPYEFDLAEGKVGRSPQLSMVFGLPPDSDLPTRAEWLKRIHDDDRSGVIRSVEDAARTGKEHHYEYRITHPDGTLHWLETHGRAIPDAQGRGTRLIGFLREITQRKRAEELLRRNNETFQRLIEYNPMGIYVLDADLKLRNVSLGARRAFANVPEPLIGREFSECMHVMWPEPFATEAVNHFKHTLETGEPYVSANTIERRRDIGEVEAYDWRIERITLPDGRFGVVCYFYDLTERQRLEQELRESESRHAFLVRLGDALRPLADPYAIKEEAERVLGEHLRASRVAYFDVLEGDYVVDCDYADSVPHIAGRYPIASFGSRLLNLYRSGQTAVHENIIADETLCEDERAAYAAIQVCAFVGVPLVKNGGLLAGLAVHMACPRVWTTPEVHLIEATAERTWAAVERAHAERNLHERDERLRLAIQHSHLAAWQCDSSKRFNWVYNPRFGPAEGELLGMTLEELEANEAMSEFVAQVREVLDKGEGSRKTIRYVPSNGRERYFDQQVEPVHGATGEPLGIIGTSLDVTERVLTEQRLQKSEEGFRLMIGQSFEPMLLVNEAGVIECISKRGAELLGYQETELVGTRLDRFLDWSTKLDLSLRIQDFFQHGPLPAQGVVRIRRKESDWCWLDVHASFINYGQSPEKYMLKFEPINMEGK